MLSRVSGLVHYGRVFSDFQSMRRFRAVRNGFRPDEALLPFRLRELHGATIFCRSETTDAQVLYNTFFAKFHVPPSPLAPRTILDLGANIGTTAAHYACLYPRASILAVELDRQNAEMCRRNLSPFPNCRVLWGAVWSSDGEIAYGGEREWGFRVCQESPRHAPAFSLTTLIAQLGGFVDFMKMDVEGTEQELFSDPSWLACIRALKVEIHAPYTVAACRELLESKGFRVEFDSHHGAALFASS